MQDYSEFISSIKYNSTDYIEILKMRVLNGEFKWRVLKRKVNVKEYIYK